MNKSIVFLITLIASSFCFASTKLEIRYIGYTFNIPESPNVVAVTGDVNSTLIFKYGEPHGPESLIFSNTDNDPVLKDLIKGEGCNYRVFLRELFKQTKNTVCDQELLVPFGDLLFRDAEYGTWPGTEGLDVYYVIGKDRSSVIITGENRKSVKIEAGFLSQDQLEEVVSDYIQ